MSAPNPINPTRTITPMPPINPMNDPHPIEEMFAFIHQDEAGHEGIAVMQIGDMFFPLVGGNLSRIDILRPIARDFANANKRPVHLVKFTHREDLETIQPK
jgi:hypothetical protein